MTAPKTYTTKQVANALGLTRSRIMQMTGQPARGISRTYEVRNGRAMRIFTPGDLERFRLDLRTPHDQS